MAYKYIISKKLDPLFAISIGSAAALARINREEREKDRSPMQSWKTLQRRWALAF
ncbi:uncharacterized protein K452DRAFT_212954, partial [Aplosporella prunicola CBS 121167]